VLGQSQKVAAAAKVLDLGAGGAPYRAFFSHCIYKTQDFALLKEDQIVEGGYTQIDYVCDAKCIPEKDGFFDVVLCTEVLEHLPDPIPVIREISRLLRPGGTLLLTAPLGSGIHQEPFHFYGGYTPYFYHKVLGENGFKQIHIEANGGSFAHFAQWCVWFVKSTLNHFLHDSSVTAKLLFVVVFLVTSVPMGLMYALSRFLDRYDMEKRFTVGYHLVATK